MATLKSLRGGIDCARTVPSAGTRVSTVVAGEEPVRSFFTKASSNPTLDFVRSTRANFKQQLMAGDVEAAFTTYLTCPSESKSDLESDAFAMARRGREKPEARLAAVSFLKKLGLNEDLERLVKWISGYPVKTDSDTVVLGAIKSEPN